MIEPTSCGKTEIEYELMERFVCQRISLAAEVEVKMNSDFEPRCPQSPRL